MAFCFFQLCLKVVNFLLVSIDTFLVGQFLPTDFIFKKLPLSLDLLLKFDLLKLQNLNFTILILRTIQNTLLAQFAKPTSPIIFRLVLNRQQTSRICQTFIFISFVFDGRSLVAATPTVGADLLFELCLVMMGM